MNLNSLFLNKVLLIFFFFILFITLVSGCIARSYLVPTNKIGIPSGIFSLINSSQYSTFSSEINSIKE